MRIRSGLVAALLFLVVAGASAFTVDELIAKNIQAKGGIEKMRTIRSLRRSGKIQFGSTSMGFVALNKRTDMVRTELSWQGLTSITAYDGSVGWRVRPFRGRTDPEKIAADDLKSLQQDADIDGPLIDYKAKGNTIEYLGTEDVDGTDAHKLKVTLKNGNVRYIYLDPDYFLEIRLIDQTRIRGAEEEQQTDLGNYEQVNGVFFPFSVEVGDKGQPAYQKITLEKIEVNVDLDDAIFHFPVPPATSGK
jgi:outer membrane lipoprotein-sorting protein